MYKMYPLKLIHIKFTEDFNKYFMNYEHVSKPMIAFEKKIINESYLPAYLVWYKTRESHIRDLRIFGQKFKQ